MWPFKSRPLIDPEGADWHLENFEWLVRCYAENGCLADSKLILPKPGFFPNDGERGHARAERIFNQVKAYCQIADWPAELIPGSPVREPGRALNDVIPGRAKLGTYQSGGRNIARITYAANLVDDPQSLIATFAHEIGHYIIERAPLRIVCADDETEFLTDLAAVYMGFGVFLANTAFSFQQWRDDALGTQGWRTKRHGYLPERDLVFATAIFVRVKGLSPDEARSCLKPHLAKDFGHALRDLDGRAADIKHIRSIEKEAAGTK